MDSRTGRMFPVNPRHKKVRIMICGPTVYDYSHVGHARLLLLNDLLARYLRASGSLVNVLVNLTDIDPKVFARARIEHVLPHEIATRYIGELLKDVMSMKIDGFQFARVSEYVSTAKTAVKSLLLSGQAYQRGSNAYLSTKRKSNTLGSLARMSWNDVEDCRLDISAAKQRASDLLVWNSNESPGVEYSDEILGSGIPWWHMQDTSVSLANYGGIYDIHTGATELKYPHHGAHMTQLCALTKVNVPVKFWLYVGTVTKDGKKMSKSANNTVSIREAVARYGSNALRLYFYSHEHSTDLEFREEALGPFVDLDLSIKHSLKEIESMAGASRYFKPFCQKISNDLDTPGAVGLMRKAADSGDPGLEPMAKIFGLE